jgi:hypothetical protein
MRLKTYQHVRVPSPVLNEVVLKKSFSSGTLAGVPSSVVAISFLGSFHKSYWKKALTNMAV